MRSLVLLLSLGFSMGLWAQVKDATIPKAASSNVKSTVLDVNDLACHIQNNGSIGYHPNTNSSGLYYPKDQEELGMLYSAGLMLAGIQNGELRTACTMYVPEYQPGHILPSGIASDPALAQIYKYRKGEIVDKEAIDLGCPSEVMGDQMVFFVCNDLGPEHEWSGKTTPIGVETQVTIFAYHGPFDLARTLYIHYRLINKNSNGFALDSAFVGYWLDPDLGDPDDDAFGSDTVRSMVYAYNGDEQDEGFYGNAPPALGCCLLLDPAAVENKPSARLLNQLGLCGRRINQITSISGYDEYAFYDGGWVTIDRPWSQIYSHYLQGFSYKQTPISGPVFSRWIDPQTNLPTFFPYSGDPIDGTGWLFRHSNNPRDIRMILSSGPFTLAHGDTQEVWYALMVGDGKLNGGEDVASSITALRRTHAQASFVASYGFQPPVMDSVTAEAIEEDGLMGLSWDASSESHDAYGYGFEGYTVWIADDPAHADAVRIATYDVENGVTTIDDVVRNGETGLWEEQTVQFGMDSGLTHEIRLTEDPRTGDSVVNNRTYYLGISTYGYNPDGLPRVITSEISWIAVTPHRPVLDSAERLGEINVFPNPYYGYHQGEALSDGQYMTVSNLPADDCTIRIFALSGTLVKVIEHDNGTPFERIPLFNEAWFQMASGVYLIHVQTAYGHRVLKWALVNRALY